jgi:uncharacterized protein
MINNTQQPNQNPEPLQYSPPTVLTAASETAPPAPPTPSRWGAWPAIGLGSVILLVFVIVQNIVALVFAIIDIAKAYSSNPGLDIIQYLQSLTTSLITNGQLISVAEVFSAAAGLGFIYLFIKIRHSFSFREYLELKPLGIRTVLILLAVFIVILGLSEVAGRFIPPQSDTFTVNIYKTAGWLPLLWFAVGVCAPIFEESFFRGFLFVSLKDSFIGPGGTIVLTSLMFASLHAIQYDVYGVAVVFVLGITFGVVRFLTGSLWSTILLHAIWNLTELVIVAVSLR